MNELRNILMTFSAAAESGISTDPEGALDFSQVLPLPRCAYSSAQILPSASELQQQEQPVQVRQKRISAEDYVDLLQQLVKMKVSFAT
ncbi:hypothetical protein ACTXT7_013254 [Hymenolepis weldensis]